MCTERGLLSVTNNTVHTSQDIHSQDKNGTNNIKKMIVTSYVYNKCMALCHRSISGIWIFLNSWDCIKLVSWTFIINVFQDCLLCSNLTKHYS